MKVLEKEIVLLTNLTLREFNSVKNLTFYPESRLVIAPKVESKKLSDLIKFRNQFNDNTEINDISKSISHLTKQGQTVLHTLQAIDQDSRARILHGSEEKIIYNTFAYLDSVSLGKNITW